ncbi:type IV toxin-antitoxin system AbiEi family antitoxin domain-containing protein [Arthrobacter sp. LAPM80]|uniref:hypothetical protein n=1 Tax=Arthrobacter sp. LAPM80 TaxID=3141788 RepID=UPI00398B6961
MPKLIRSAEYDRLGEDRRKLATLQRQGELVRVSRGIYVESADWNGLSGKERYGLKAAAFVRQAGREPVFCHATAALLWGLWIVGTPQKLHAITEVRTSGRSSGGVTRHIGSLSEGVQRCGRFLVTDKLTTTLQLIGSLAFPYAVAVCDSSLRVPRGAGKVNLFTVPDSDPFQQWPAWETDSPQGLPLTVEELQAAANLLPSKASRTRIHKVIDFASGLSGSAGESISRAKMFQLGFPEPVLQQRFELRDGRNAFVDFWFKEQRAVGEFDGKGKYLRAGWGGGLSLQGRIMAEKSREDQIRAFDVGFARWDWKELMDSDKFTSILRQAGLRQSWSSAAPPVGLRKMP